MDRNTPSPIWYEPADIPEEEQEEKLTDQEVKDLISDIRWKTAKGE